MDGDGILSKDDLELMLRQLAGSSLSQVPSIILAKPHDPSLRSEALYRGDMHSEKLGAWPIPAVRSIVESLSSWRWCLLCSCEDLVVIMATQSRPDRLMPTRGHIACFLDCR